MNLGRLKYPNNEKKTFHVSYPLMLNHTQSRVQNCDTGLMACIATFKVEKGGLPDPHGPLAKTVPSSSIASEFKVLGSLY